jgi:hypothetical protein
MWDHATGLFVRLTTRHCLDNVQMVLNLIEAAVIRQAIEKRANCVLRGHGNLTVSGANARIRAPCLKLNNSIRRDVGSAG